MKNSESVVATKHRDAHIKVGHGTIRCKVHLESQSHCLLGGREPGIGMCKVDAGGCRLAPYRIVRCDINIVRWEDDGKGEKWLENGWKCVGGGLLDRSQNRRFRIEEPQETHPMIHAMLLPPASSHRPPSTAMFLPDEDFTFLVMPGGSSTNKIRLISRQAITRASPAPSAQRALSPSWALVGLVFAL
jgi:hypothetical protein